VIAFPGCEPRSDCMGMTDEEREDVGYHFVMDVDGLCLNVMPTFDRYVAMYPEMEDELAELALHLVLEVDAKVGWDRPRGHA